MQRTSMRKRLKGWPLMVILFASMGGVSCAEEQLDAQDMSVSTEGLPSNTVSTSQRRADEAPLDEPRAPEMVNTDPTGDNPITLMIPDMPMAGRMESDLVLRPPSSTVNDGVDQRPS